MSAGIRNEDISQLMGGGMGQRAFIREESDITIIRNQDYYANDVTIYVKVLTLADTEYFQVLPANTRMLELFARNGSAFRWALSASKVASTTKATSTAFWAQATIPYKIEHVRLSGKTLYLASSVAAEAIQITCWTG